MPASNNFLRKTIEYGVYIVVLLLCIAGLYWRFWYRPKVEPVVMIDPTEFVSQGQAVPSPLLDPNFTWSLVQITHNPRIAILEKDRGGERVSLKIDDTIQGWKIKSIEKTMVVVVNAVGDERALFYNSKQPVD